MPIVFEIFPNPRLQIVVEKERSPLFAQIGCSINNVFSHQSIYDPVIESKTPSISLAFNVLPDDIALLFGKRGDGSDPTEMILPLYINMPDESNQKGNTGNNEPYAYVRLTNINETSKPEKIKHLDRRKQKDAAYEKNDCQKKRTFFNKVYDFFKC